MRAFLPRIRQFLHGRLMGLVRIYYKNLWGMSLGEGVRISLSAKMDKTYPEGLFIGDYTAVAFGATILTHDIATLKRVRTTIGSHCLIGARSIILPGVTIGDHCVIGAGSVVMTNIAPHSLAVGNPARVIERGINTTIFGIRQEAYDLRFEEAQRRKAASA
ncbi:acyltransferase [Roseiarcus sp.]|jgi:acetyltransferase-like isoleucine patch superfamily enzyme|uniref:acyltransferase n=1 Tax=Roseiarcus sp. TaxID=1969460 RepID=UPI003D12C8B7